MTTGFTINGNTILDPNGNVWAANGINIMEGEQPTASQILTDFPGINFVRLACYDYPTSADFISYVNSLTSAGIVVELENHNNGAGNAGGGQGVVFTGAALQQEQAWYSSVASTFSGNPNVWFGTNNEPSDIVNGADDPAATLQWQQTTVDTIRATGNTNPIMVETLNYVSDSTGQAVNYAAGAPTGTNLIWDQHFYGTGNPSTTASDLSAFIAGDEAIAKLPVIVGEYGNSMTGVGIDTDADQTIAAVASEEQSGATSGSAAWVWDSGNPGDGLITAYGGTQLSSYGQQIAANIAAEAKILGNTTPPVVTPPVVTPPVVTPPVTPPVTTTPSANDTVVLNGASTSITDASGNTWTVTNGVVDENGAAAGYSANVTEIAYVNGSVWQENNANDWWQWNATDNSWDGSAGNGTSVSPLPTTPPVTPPVVPPVTPPVVPPVVPPVTPPTTSTPTVTLTEGANNTTVTSSGKEGGDNFVISRSTGNVAIGNSAQSLSFIGFTNMNINDMSKAAATVTDPTQFNIDYSGRNTGLLTINDFSTALGDTITVSTHLGRQLTETSDGNGGTLISFGNHTGGIDLLGVTTPPNIIFHGH